MIDQDDIKDGQLLWYCKLDFHEVTYVKNPYQDDRVLARFPPNNIQCFSEVNNLYISKRNAIDFLIKRIEQAEEIILNKSYDAQENKIEPISTIIPLYDGDKSNLMLKHILRGLEERLTRLEINNNKEIKNG